MARELKLPQASAVPSRGSVRGVACASGAWCRARYTSRIRTRDPARDPLDHAVDVIADAAHQRTLPTVIREWHRRHSRLSLMRRLESRLGDRGVHRNSVEEGPEIGAKRGAAQHLDQRYQACAGSAVLAGTRDPAREPHHFGMEGIADRPDQRPISATGGRHRCLELLGL